MNRATLLIAGFTLALASALLTSSCAQPRLNCSSARGPFAAEYTLIDGDPGSACAQLPGDILGMTTYFQPGGRNGTPDYQDAELAIRPASLGTLVAYAEARGVIDIDEVYHDPNAIGPFTAGFPGDDEFCRVVEFEAAELSLPAIEAVADDPSTPEIDESLPAQAAVDLRYQWRDARLLVTADAQGTQFEAELEVTEGDCSATYRVVGLYPAVECQADADCEDERNGINPDFAVRCNMQIGLCVLDAELPAYE